MTDLHITSDVHGGKVLPMRKDPQYVAWCPECRCKEWEILIDGIGDEWKNVIGTRCVDCGFTVDWITCHRGHDGDEAA